MKFRKKPIVIEAEQFVPFEDDMGKPVSNLISVYMDMKNSKTNWSLETLEGRFDVTPGDWIIKGIKGEFYSCKPDIFKKTYDDITEDDSETVQNGLTITVDSPEAFEYQIFYKGRIVNNCDMLHCTGTLQFGNTKIIKCWNDIMYESKISPMGEIIGHPW